MKIHLMGICGTAMASLAGLLKDQGHVISGSDQNVYPPMSTQLEKLGIALTEGYRAENLNHNPDLVIVGNVISKTNPEAAALMEKKLAYTSLPKALGEYVIAGRESIVIAGTHGKTTTTSIMAAVSDQVPGINAGYMVGGIPLNFGVSFRQPKGNWFIIEGDEYDTAYFDKVPKFIHYKPKHVILTSIEFDHADIYKDLDHVKSSFRELIKLIPKDGTLVYWAEDPHIHEMLPLCKGRVISYGATKGDYQFDDRESVAGRNQFVVVKNGERYVEIAVKLFGLHNTLNSLAVFAMTEALKWPLDRVLQGFANFQGVKRRQEVLGEWNDVVLMEDFAHHPTAVRMTIDCVRERYPDRRVIAVFEPRSATSRRKVFQKDYSEALSRADLAFVAQAFDQSKIDANERFSIEELLRDIKAVDGSRGDGGGRAAGNVFSAADTPALASAILSKVQAKDVILVMSNGGFDGIYGILSEGLKRRV